MVVAVELTELVLAVPFAVLSVHINPNGTNLAGIDANVALFGAVLLIFGVFNAVFLPAFYKTAVRVGRSFLLAVVPMTVLMVLVEALSHFPVVGPYLDATDAAGQVRQLPVLAVGLAAFALLFVSSLILSIFWTGNMIVIYLLHALVYCLYMVFFTARRMFS